MVALDPPSNINVAKLVYKTSIYDDFIYKNGKLACARELELAIEELEGGHAQKRCGWSWRGTI